MNVKAKLYQHFGINLTFLFLEIWVAIVDGLKTRRKRKCKVFVS